MGQTYNCIRANLLDTQYKTNLEEDIADLNTIYCSRQT